MKAQKYIVELTLKQAYFVADMLHYVSETHPHLGDKKLAKLIKIINKLEVING